MIARRPLTGTLRNKGKRTTAPSNSEPIFEGTDGTLPPRAPFGVEPPRAIDPLIGVRPEVIPLRLS